MSVINIFIQQLNRFDFVLDFVNFLLQIFYFLNLDTTPPDLLLTRKPAAISNEDQVIFTWTCPAPCSTTCTFYGPNNSVSANCSLFTSYWWTLPSRTSNITYSFKLEAIDDVGNKIAVDHQWKTGMIRITTVAKTV